MATEVHNSQVNGKIKTTCNCNGNSKHGNLTEDQYSYEHLQEIAQFLLERVQVRPKIGIIFGTGLGALADVITERTVFQYSDIPYFPVSTVVGHVGQLVFGRLAGADVLCMQGRFHLFEGYPLWKCTMPVRVMKLIGVTHLLATNAAGGLNPAFKVGDIMLMRDHINMVGFSGNNPLQGPNDDRFGPRFPPMNHAYDRALIRAARTILDELQLSAAVHEGVYTCLGGPNFETVAELRMLKMLGADAVGMSTAHEVVTARHCDMKVLALSLITNVCVMSHESTEEANHVEIIDVGKARSAILQQFFIKLVQHIHKNFIV